MSNGTIKPVDLRERTLLFAKDIIRLIKPLQANKLIFPLLSQLIRSATSIGANFAEAKDAGSKKDFRNKVLITKKEAAETLYWLRILEEYTSSPELFKAQQECREIILILQKIVSTVTS